MTDTKIGELTAIDMPPEPSGKKIIGPLYIRGPNDEGHYRFEIPYLRVGPLGGAPLPGTDGIYEPHVNAHECMLLSIMFFKAVTNRDVRPLDFWEYITRHNLQRFFVKIEGEEPTDG